MVSKFLVHAKDDHVGVATYDIKKGEEVEGVYLVIVEYLLEFVS